MSLVLVDKNRRVIPRWRDIATTAALGELQGTRNGQGVPSTFSDSLLYEKHSAWRLDPSMENAAEFIELCVVVRREADGLDAARQLLKCESDLAPGIRVLARRVSGLSASDALPKEAVEVETAVTRRRVRLYRLSLRRYPRDAVGWAEVAREYVLLGQASSAQDAMMRALAIARANRFVLRAAARLFVHLGDPEHAHDILTKASSTRHDPWLMASEIAVAEVATRRPAFATVARRYLQSTTALPRTISELRAALGTLEYASGNSKVARRLFRDSLIAPNENALAQTLWASRRLTGLAVDEDLLHIPRSFEARAWHAFGAEAYSEALAGCEAWSLDEPFSNRPAEMGSYLAISVLGEPARGERLALRGLMASPDAPGLLNNLVVALAYQGRLSDAEKEFRKIERSDLPKGTDITVRATEGLLAFRRGEVERGRALYRSAVDEATEPAYASWRSRALVHWAREEAAFGCPEADAILLRAEADARGGLEPDQQKMVADLKALLALRRAAE